jgi:hypothetical protein
VLEDEAREAQLASPLGGLPVDVRHVLCRDAVMIDVPAGSHVFRAITPPQDAAAPEYPADPADDRAPYPAGNRDRHAGRPL